MEADDLPPSVLKTSEAGEYDKFFFEKFVVLGEVKNFQRKSLTDRRTF